MEKVKEKQKQRKRITGRKKGMKEVDYMTNNDNWDENYNEYVLVRLAGIVWGKCPGTFHVVWGPEIRDFDRRM